MRSFAHTLVMVVLAGCGSVAPAPPDANTSSDTATLIVQNESSHTVLRLYVAQCSSTSWGVNQLNGKMISPGNSFRLTDIPPSCYQFRAEADGGSWERDTPTYLEAGGTFTWVLTGQAFTSE